MKRFGIVIFLVFLICACITGFFLFKDVEPYIKIHTENKELKEQVIQTPKETVSSNKKDDSSSDDADESEESLALNRSVDFAQLHQINKNIIGWLYIPAINVDLPILYSENYEYLTLDYKGNYSALGSVFVWGKGACDLNSNHCCIFAHNLVTGQMFGNLSKLKGSDAIYVYQADTVYEYRVENTLSMNSDDHYFSVENPYNDGEQRITLVTCNGDVGTPIRYCVVARRIR